MKKVKAGKRSSAAKGKSKGNVATKIFAEDWSSVPKTARDALKKMRAAIRSSVPSETTEIISYQIPAFRHKKVLVWYAAFSNHCSLFPTASVIEKFKDELKGFSTTKGTIHFPIDKPVPLALIEKLVKARVAQSEGKKQP
jgi:uncharacterized protein YdhG (YjbR/CyaY superfamily)